MKSSNDAPHNTEVLGPDNKPLSVGYHLAFWTRRKAATRDELNPNQCCHTKF